MELLLGEKLTLWDGTKGGGGRKRAMMGDII